MMSRMESINLTVNGMTCRHCELRVTAALAQLDGVAQAKASAKDNLVQVGFDADRLDIGQLREAIEDAGYQVP